MRIRRLLPVLAGIAAVFSPGCAQIPPLPPARPAPAASPAAPVPAAERPAALEFKMDRPSARAGEKVSLVIEVVNRSDKPLKIKTRQIFLHLRLDVRQPDGTCCRYNPYNNLRVNPVENFEWETLPPGGRMELARLALTAGEAFEPRSWQTYKLKGKPIDWFERFPLSPEGRILEDIELPKPFTQKGLHNLFASYNSASNEAGVVTSAESPFVDFTVAP